MESKILLDTNAVLRYLLGDVEQQYNEVKQILEVQPCIVSLEVIAETVHVLEKVYQAQRNDIIDSFRDFMDDVVIPNGDVLLRALEQYDGTPKMDFIDCLMCGYKMARGYEILTFDRKLKKRLDSIILPVGGK